MIRVNAIHDNDPEIEPVTLTAAELRGTTMRFGRVGNVYVCIHPDRPPSDDDWSAWLADMERHAREVTGLFVYTRGGGPDPRKRQQTTEMWSRARRTPPIALVTGSTVVRTMMTALNFFLANPIRPFSEDAIGEALAHVGLEHADHAAVRACIGPSLAILMGSPAEQSLSSS